MKTERRVAGVDTREAKATATVRAAARAAAFAAGPGWASAIAAPIYLQRWFSPAAGAVAWMTVGLICSGIAAGLLGWRREPFPRGARWRLAPVGADAVVLMMLLSFMVARPRDAALVAFVLPLGPILAGWSVGRAARLAGEACVEQVRSAAFGVTITGAFVGLVIAVHLNLVVAGAGGPARGGLWALAYCTLSLVSFVRLGWSFGGDRRRAVRRAAPLPDEIVARTATALTCAEISVTFGENQVLRGTTLTVAPGELVALVGGNGAGKSTLLRVAAGLLVADSGRVFVDGEDISELLPEERAAAGLAFVSGARPVFVDMSVADNLRVAAFRTHLTGKAFDTATAAVFELIPALARRKDSKAGVLSGGEQRMLAVAQTLYRRPKVLLADELSLGLDTEARTAVIDLLRLLADEGVATVVVDHDLVSLLPRADRAALLVDGSVEDVVPATAILETRSELLPATFLAGAAG